MNSISIKEIKWGGIIPPKIVLSVKICLLLFVCCVTQAFSATTYSQATTLSMKLKNVSIEEVLNNIEEQSEFRFLYNKKLVNVEKKVSLDVNKKNITEILDELFKGENVSYTISNRQVVLTEKKEASAFQQEKEISGTVRDNKGEPLIGVSVSVKGSFRGTITDAEGNFSIVVPSGESILVISYLGYLSKEMKVGAETNWKITLLEDAQLLEEVVVVGYATQKKVNLTGAVGQVTSKVLDNRAIQNTGQGLQGTIANLNIITNPGDPGKIGQGASYQIRGPGSINGGSPLTLIDGVQGDLNQINPSDIESISVLKDAASSAIYGARATFGVILVTTKKGSHQKTSVSVNASISSNSITNFPKGVNSLQYAETMNEASRNAGIADYFGPEQIERIKKYMENPGSIPTTVPEPGDPNRWSYALGNDNINYMKIYYKERMLSQKYDLAISGGSKAADYRFSVGYLDQNGVYAFGQDVYKRYNVLGNVNSELTKWLSFKFQAMLNVGETNEPYEYAGNMGNYFHIAYTRQPHWPFYDPNGHPMWTSQKQYLEGARRNTEDDEMKLVGEIIIKPTADWSVNTRVSYDKQLEDGKAHEAKLYAWGVDDLPYLLYGTNSFTKSYLARDYKNFELFSTYSKQIKDHWISALLGMQMEKYMASSVGGYVPNLVTDDIPSLNTGTGKKNTWDSTDEWANLGYFGRLNYNYKERYLFEANARYDGTSKFPAGKRWGFFPSVSGGWNIAKESFFKIPQINMLKLRASYGLLGNQQVANYLFFSKVPIYANLAWIMNGDMPNYIGTPGLISTNLTWATAKTLDFGLDVQALNNRLSFSFDWYRRNTVDMIGPANAVPAVLGTSVPQTNNADMLTKGFEMTVGWRDQISNDFNYGIQFNLSDYMSEITKYNNPNKLLSTYYEGQKLGDIWGFETAGIIQTEEQLAQMADQRTYIYNTPWHIGDIEYRDLDGNNVISYGKSTLDDPGDQRVIGNSTPRFAFGLIADCSWKGFDFSMFWQGIMKRDVWLGDIPFFGITGSWTQQVYETTTDYWSPTNTGAYFARPYASGEIQKNQIVQSRFLQNAAYIRLKNMQIGYTLPTNLLSKLKLEKIRFFINGENLLYSSPIDENFDPERVSGSWGNGKTYPLFRTFTAGINIKL